MLSAGKSSLPATRADQATRLRQLVRGGVPAQTLAITSGKGGVGKSNIAVNLAISLAGRGVRVTLVDVDLGLANADLLMNIHPRYTLAHVLSGARGIAEVLIEGPGGIRFVAGASGLHEMADLAEFDRAALIAQLHNLEINTDMIILDCGAGLSRNVTGFALAADQVLVVTTPQPTALTDAYATIKALTRERYPGRIGLFVNMARTRADAVATYNRVNEVAQRFLNYSVANCGFMLHDTAVELAVQERCPFVVRFPGSNASTCIAAVASEFAKASEVRAPRGGFFRRVVGLFV